MKIQQEKKKAGRQKKIRLLTFWDSLLNGVV